MASRILQMGDIVAAAREAHRIVDEKEREVLSVGLSLSKNPTFIDHVEITIVFGLATALGRAPSTFSFDGRGGFLILRKHYRGTATLSQPAVAF